MKLTIITATIISATTLISACGQYSYEAITLREPEIVLSNRADNINTEKIPLQRINQRNMLLNENETGIDTNLWWKEMPNDIYSGMISSQYSDNGSPAYRFELRRDDNEVYNSKRSEVAWKYPEEPLEEHTYYFDILLPDGGDEDYQLDQRSPEILVQWHSMPDPGESWTLPPLSLQTFNGCYYLYRAWDDEEITNDEQIKNKDQLKKYNLGSYIQDKGRFTHWAFHVKWGWLESQNPILEVYKDGRKILDLSGQPNTMNDRSGIYQKLGIYKCDWKENPAASVLDRRVVYINNVYIE